MVNRQTYFVEASLNKDHPHKISSSYVENAQNKQPKCGQEVTKGPYVVVSTLKIAFKSISTPSCSYCRAIYMSNHSLDYHGFLKWRYSSLQKTDVFVFDFSCRWKVSRIAKSPFFASQISKVYYVCFILLNSIKLGRILKVLFVYLTKVKWSHWSIFFFFGNFLKVLMSRSQPRYKSAWFAIGLQSIVLA